MNVASENKKRKSADKTVSRVKINYGNGVVVFPAAAAQRLLSASRSEAAVLLGILTHPETDPADLSGLCAVPEEDVRAALAFWRGVGVIDVVTEEAPDEAPAAEKVRTEEPREAETEQDKQEKQDKQDKHNKNEGKSKKVPLRQSTDLPEYTMEETAALLEGNADYSKMVDECSRIIGKVLTINESARLIALVDQLGLNPEFVLLVCAHCKSAGKSSLRYIMTTAVEYFDKGINSVDGLEEYLHSIENVVDAEGQLRKLLGIGSRAFGKRDKDFLERWCGTYEYDFEVVRIAFEIAADNNVAKPMPYMNGIIEKWHEAGCKNAEDVRALIDREKAERAGQLPAAKPDGSGISFEVNDFFGAALKRSYEESGTLPDVPQAFDRGGDAKNKK